MAASRSLSLSKDALGLIFSQASSSLRFAGAHTFNFCVNSSTSRTPRPTIHALTVLGSRSPLRRACLRLQVLRRSPQHLSYQHADAVLGVCPPAPLSGALLSSFFPGEVLRPLLAAVVEGAAQLPRPGQGPIHHGRHHAGHVLRVRGVPSGPIVHLLLRGPQGREDVACEERDGRLGQIGAWAVEDWDTEDGAGLEQDIQRESDR